MKTLKQACAPRPATFDPSRRDTGLDFSDLVEDRIDSGDAEAAVAGVNRYLSRKGLQPERLESSTILDVPWARSSRHSRPAPAGPISLHHAFFGLRPAPGAAHTTSEAEP